MKRTIFNSIWFILLITLGAVPLAFAKSPGGVYQPDELPYKNSILKQAWNGDLNMQLDVNTQGVDPSQVITDPAFYQDAVQNAYDAWFKGTAQHIRDEKREGEFSDVYGRLQQGVRISSDPSRRPNLKVEVIPQQEFQKRYQNALAATEWSKHKSPIIVIPLVSKEIATDTNKRNAFQSTLTHEAGHTLGFTEQYSHYDRQAANKQRSSSGWDSRSVMNGGDTNYTQISTRDGTTLINQLDAEGLTQRRQGQKWASLDKTDPDVYQNGKRLGSENENQIIQEGNNTWSLSTPTRAKRTYKIHAKTQIQSLGEIMEAQVYPIRKDAQGRPLEGRDAHGNQVIYSYQQGYTTRMFFAGNNLIGVDQTTQDVRGAGYKVQAGINGKIEEMTARTHPKTGQMVFDYKDEITLVCPQEQAQACAAKKLAAYKACTESGIQSPKEIASCMKQKVGADKTPQKNQAQQRPKQTQYTPNRTGHKPDQAQHQRKTNPSRRAV